MVAFAFLGGIMIAVWSVLSWSSNRRTIMYVSPRSLRSLVCLLVFAFIGVLAPVTKSGDLIEAMRSAALLASWGVVFLCVSGRESRFWLSSDTRTSLLRYFLNLGVLVAALAVVQKVVWQLLGIHLSMRPAFLPRASWGSTFTGYRPTVFSAEPSWLALILLQPLASTLAVIASGNGSWRYLLRATIIASGIAVSQSTGGVLVAVIATVVLFIWIKPSSSTTARGQLLRKLTIIVSFCVFTASATVLIPLLRHRLTQELMVEGQSVFRRFSGYVGAIFVFQRYPLFGVGFGQSELIREMLGGYFEFASSLNWLIASTGLVGVAAFLRAITVLFTRRRLSSGLDEASAGASGILIAVVLSQIFLIAGILLPEFWIPLLLSTFLHGGERQPV